MKHVRLQIKISLLIAVCAYILFRLGFGLTTVTKDVQTWYQVYKLEKTITCSSQSPVWMKDIIKTSIQNSIPAGQIAFYSKGGEISHCEYGYANIQNNNSLVTEKTRFKYASISKLFTSDAVLSMVRSELISLDDSLVELLNLDISKLTDQRIAKITITDLLTHTGGFNRSVSWDPMFMIRKNVWCPNNLNKLYEIELDFSPSKERHYSNLGYCLLGEIIAKHSNLSFEQYMSIHYKLEKFGIKYAHNNQYFEDEVSYSFMDEDLKEYMNVFDMDAIQSSAGMTGNAIELVKLASDTVKKAEPNILTLDSRHDCNNEYRKCYAFGTFKYRPPHSSKDFYIRNGSLPGFTGTLIIQPEAGIVAFLGNSRRVGKEEGVTRSIEQKIFNGLSLK